MRFARFLVVGFLLAVSAHAQTLWGDLAAGPFPVGFRTKFQFDASRTWEETRDYAGKFTPDSHGRPIQINIWYPAVVNSSYKRLFLSDYIDQVAPPEFAKISGIMQQRNRDNVLSAVEAAAVSQLLASPVAAFAAPPTAPEKFPLLLYFAGLNGDINSNAILSEFLASHGYVVASISLLGLSDVEYSQARTPAHIEASLLDMGFALGLLSKEPYIDIEKIATIGHSVGAVEAALFAARNGNVSAIVGLDGTYGFKGSASVLIDHFGYSPSQIRAPFLDLRRAQGEQDADLDLTPVLSLNHADRTLVTLSAMHHSDFTSFAMVADLFQVPIRPTYANTGWDRAVARRGYQHACDIILAFLNEKIKRAGSADNSNKAIEQAGGSLSHLDAEPVAPSPSETVVLVHQLGLPATQALVTEICMREPDSSCVNPGLFNSYGYHLLGQQNAKDAVIAFEIAAWAYPTSANAQDSLADGYLALGDSAKARDSLRRAIDLVPTDATISPESKDSFLAEVKRRLDDLR